MADDPTCGAVLDRAEIGYIDHDGDHVCTLGPEHPHIRNHVCHCGYVWPRVNSPTTTRATAPTATQLYNAVKALRAANGYRVLTIPEINSVLVARDEYAAGVAAGPQATPDQVLWEGETTEAERISGWSYVADNEGQQRRDWGRCSLLVQVPGGTRVRVVAVPTDHEDPA